jgi:predicted nucleic acid-binding protein
MSDPFVDTDVIIRLLTGDDLQKQAKAAALFEQVESGTVTLSAPITVIADCVYVLSSPRLYNLPRSEIVALLTPLLHLPHFQVESRRMLQKALDLYLAARLDFGDAVIVASMQQAGAQSVYSYDAGFDRIKGIARSEP